MVANNPTWPSRIANGGMLDSTRVVSKQRSKVDFNLV